MRAWQCDAENQEAGVWHDSDGIKRPSHILPSSPTSEPIETIRSGDYVHVVCGKNPALFTKVSHRLRQVHRPRPRQQLNSM